LAAAYKEDILEKQRIKFRRVIHLSKAELNIVSSYFLATLISPLLFSGMPTDTAESPRREETNSEE
jgi:hypothetical protein